MAVRDCGRLKRRLRTQASLKPSAALAAPKREECADRALLPLPQLDSERRDAVRGRLVTSHDCFGAGVADCTATTRSTAFAGLPRRWKNLWGADAPTAHQPAGRPEEMPEHLLAIPGTTEPHESQSHMFANGKALIGSIKLGDWAMRGRDAKTIR